MKKIRKNLTIILALVVLMFSCKKTETEVNQETGTQKIEKFFENSKNIKTSIDRVVEKLKIFQSVNKTFILNLAKNGGFPIWNKSIVKIKQPNSGRSNSTSTDTVVLIPLQQGNDTKLNGYIEAHLNDSVLLALQLRANYKNLPNGNLSSTVNTAEHFAMEIMLLEKNIFGYDRFIIQDKHLLRHTSNSQSVTTNKILKLKFSSSNTSGRTTLTGDDGCYKVEIWNTGADMIEGTADDWYTGDWYWDGDCGSGTGFGNGYGYTIGNVLTPTYVYTSGSGGISGGGTNDNTDEWLGEADDYDYIDMDGYKRPFKASNFRYNLGIRSGLTNQPSSMNAHHIFPQAFGQNFANAGIDIHNPNFGVWWSSPGHQQQSYAYNQDWLNWFGTFPANSPPTAAQILAQGKIIMASYGFPASTLYY